MTPFIRLTATACPLPLSNVDTDQLIPARFMTRSRAQGYGGYLLHDLRFDDAGAPRPGFPLNDPARQGTQILVARRNFGAGSSREAAVYALVDHGVRCVIAPSFGDIFASNGVSNGLLTARVTEADAEALLAALEAGLPEVMVDLEAQAIAAGDLALPFAVDPVWRTKLINGWDDIDLTLTYADAIETFAQEDSRRRPWGAPHKAGPAPSLK